MGIPQFDLERFMAAQASIYEQALGELRAGHKRSHWMWFIFPQIVGLGHSSTSRRYAIASLPEARAYLAHPVLGSRLRECTAAVTDHTQRSAGDIFGWPDELKFRSCMTLFATATSPASIFTAALQAFFNGVPDLATVHQLAMPEPE